MIRFFSALFALFLLMQTAHAEEVTPWMFKGQMTHAPDRCKECDMTVEPTQNGLLVRNQSEGYIIWAGNPLEGPVDVITIRARSVRPTKVSVFWHPKGAKSDEFLQIYADIPGGGTSEQTDMIVSGSAGWNWETTQLGLALPPGSEILIEEIQFRHWPLYERMSEWWRSFWTFDSFLPYSINFLWGPLIAGNAPQREALYEHLPPTAHSVTRYFYMFLAGVAAVSLVAGRKRLRRDAAVGWFIAACALVWLIFDVRMGAEILSYATHDLRTYVFAERGQLRNYQNVHAIVQRMAPELRKHPRFAMVTPHREIYFPLLRYQAYPSLIMAEPASWSGSTAWAVIGRSDIWVDASGRLRQGVRNNESGTVLTPPGHIAVPFDDATFLFTVP